MLVPPSVGSVRVDVVRALWLWGNLAGAAAGLATLTPALTIAALAITFFTLCVGHSVGLHRGYIHDTYRAPAVVRGALAWLFVFTGLGGPLSWIRLHAARDYWQSRADCPKLFAYAHSAARDFLWNLHMRFVPADDRALAKLPAGVVDDRWLAFLERTWPLHVLAFAAAAFAIGGADAVAVCVCARVAASILGHWAVGYAAHVCGERRFVVDGARESGTNVWALGVVSFGEGFHNNHHAHPWSARMGMRAHDVDLGWLVICALERLRVVDGVRAWHRDQRDCFAVRVATTSGTPGEDSSGVTAHAPPAKATSATSQKSLSSGSSAVCTVTGPSVAAS